MRHTVFIAFVVAASITVTLGADLRVLIAPESSIIPSSGRVSINVYWINDGERPATIPPTKSYSLSYAVTSRTGRTLPPGGVEAVVVDHPDPDRQIPARTIIRDHVEMKLSVTANELVEVYGEFRGSRKEFKSNTVVLTRTR